MVLLHGIGAGSASWVHQLDGLASDFHLVAWDAPGYGLSKPLPAVSPAAAEYADVLKMLLDSLGIVRCILVGHSLGAIVAASFAAHCPERVLGLLLLAPANGYGRADPDVRAEKLAARLKALDELGVEGLAAARAPHLLSARASPEALELVRFDMGQVRVDGYAQASRLLANGWLVDDAARFPGPALIACGSADEITPPDDCRHIAMAFAQQQFVLLPGLGHAAQIEDPAAVNALIAEFALRHRGPPA